MDQSMLNRFKKSFKLYGLVQPLVIRLTKDALFEVLSETKQKFMQIVDTKKGLHIKFDILFCDRYIYPIKDIDLKIIS